MNNYQRIHIMGGAGNGKTTLAKWLSQKLGYPCYHLDQVGWNDKGKVPLDERMIQIEGILSKPQWITEGAFLWWTDPLLKNADVIVYLDLPFRINAWRMVKRHIDASLQGNNPHSGIGNLIDFVYGVGKKYYMKQPLTPKAPDDDFAITRVGTIEVLSHYQEKVLRCRTPWDVQSFMGKFVEV